MKYLGKITSDKDLVTREWVNANAGKIDSISVNTVPQTITDKNVDITVPIVQDNITSTSSTNALSANQGKLLNDRINNLEGMGRYLALWDCATGKPTTNPTTMPYIYKTGDYYRVSNIGSGTKYRPEGSSYNDVASTTQETEDVQIGDVYFYDGTSWSLQINHIGGLVTDVIFNTQSVVSGGVATINALTSHQSVTLASGTSNGTLKLTTNAGTTDNIAVTGLGSAAYTNTNAYATAAQGTKADNALQSVFQAGTSAPSDTRLLWIDTTANTGGLKYYNGSSWVVVPVSYT